MFFFITTLCHGFPYQIYITTFCQGIKNILLHQSYITTLSQGFSSSNLYHNTSPRFFFIKFISQVRLCKVLAMWPKVIADWLVTLSAVSSSLANCLLQSASTCELWAMEEATATTEVKKIEVFSCTVAARVETPQNQKNNNKQTKNKQTKGGGGGGGSVANHQRSWH